MISPAGTISTALVTFNIIEGTDWERSSSAGSRATVVRVRGFLSVTQLVTNSTYHAAIAVVDKDDASFDPSSPAGLVDFAPMWTYTEISGNVLATTPTKIEIDVKAMRKMTNSDRCVLVETADVVNSFQTGYTVRGLTLVA